jgi:hypothetical protein
LKRNIDEQVVKGFGEKWTRFDQSGASAEELHEQFESYFRVFPWNKPPENAVGFDLGCGSERWARSVAFRMGTLHCVANADLASVANCVFHQGSVAEIPLPDSSSRAMYGHSGASLCMKPI